MAEERYGHAYLLKDGSLIPSHKEQEDWVFERHYVENDGWSWIHRGPERQAVLSIRQNIPFSEVKSALDLYLVNENKYPQDKLEPHVISELEKMILDKKRFSSIKDE